MSTGATGVPGGRFGWVKRLALLSLSLLTSCALPGTGDKAPSEAPAPGGQIAVAITEPDSIDPSRASNRAALSVLKVLCDTLVAADPTSGALRPGLAESWTVAPDAKSVTIKLKKGAKFHNGRPLVAQDVVNSMSRFVSTTSGSPHFFLFDKVVGYADVRQQKTELLAGVKAVDESTVQVDLSVPFAEFPAVLAHPAAGAVIPKEEVERSAEAFAKKPLCTGPYTLLEPYEKGKPIKMIRSGERSHSIEGSPRGGAGFVNRITFSLVADGAAAFDLLGKGQVQVADVPIPKLEAARTSRMVLKKGTTGHVAYIGFPVSKAPFDNVELRRALALDIDRDSIVQGLLAGTRKPSLGFLPTAAGPLADEGCPTYIKPRSDPTAARKAMSASGLDPASVKPTVHLNASGGHERWLQPVIDRWGRDLAVTATMKADEWKTYLDTLVDPGATGPFRLAWAVRYPSAEALLDPLFAPGSPDNFTRYASPAFQDLLAKARATAQDAPRQDLYRQALKTICSDMPLIPMWFGQSHIAFAPALADDSMDVDIYGDPVLRELGYPAR